MGEVVYGTSSWSEASWSGSFYPDGLPQRDWLRHYSRRLATVEADVTWYRVPTRAMVEGWNRKTPDDFLLSAKFPRAIVHGGQGPQPDTSLILDPDKVGTDAEAFLGAMAELGPKCGPLVLQFPYFNKRAFSSVDPFLLRLDRFLNWLPERFRYAVEIRNSQWISPPLLDVLRDHDAALVWTDMSYMPHPAELAEQMDLVTSDFVYCRLIGDRKALDALTRSFERVVLPRQDRLMRWAELLSAVQERVTRAYVYANNHYEGHAPGTVASLMKLMGADSQRRLLLGEDNPELPFGSGQE